MKPWQRITFYVILAISIGYGAFFVFVAIFQCGPPTKLLEHVVSGHGCLSTNLLLASGYIYAVFNIAADWIFVFIPIFMLKETFMDRRSKISVGVIMALGAVWVFQPFFPNIYNVLIIINAKREHIWCNSASLFERSTLRKRLFLYVSRPSSPTFGSG